MLGQPDLEQGVGRIHAANHRQRVLVLRSVQRIDLLVHRTSAAGNLRGSSDLAGLSSYYTNIPYSVVGYVANPSLSVTAASTTLSLDVKSSTVAGTASLNGALPTDGTICTSLPTIPKVYVNFTEKTLGYSFQLDVLCSSATYSYTGVVFNGTYQVTASASSSAYSSLPATNTLVITEIQIP